MPSYFKSTLYYNDKKSNRDRLFCRIACFPAFSKAQPLGNSLSTLVCGARSDWSRTASHAVIITPRRGVIAISTASVRDREQTVRNTEAMEEKLISKTSSRRLSFWDKPFQGTI